MRIGEEISLECVSRGEGRMRPWPNITWYIGGERVRQTGHTQVFKVKQLEFEERSE